MKVYTILHISLLKSHKEPSICGRLQPFLFFVIINGIEEYKIEEILSWKYWVDVYTIQYIGKTIT